MRVSRATTEGFLYTDMYQLTMAQLYYRMGLHEKTVRFEHFFRDYPDYGAHEAGYCVNAGLEWLVNWMQDTRMRDEDIVYLRAQRSAEGNPLFDEAFLQWLKQYGTYDCLSMQAVPEGRVVHPHTPLMTITGPLAMAQILETPLLNQLNYQTLIATKAAQIREAGRGQLLLEFGLRRGPDFGANAGTRAALIGGMDFTSNVGLSCELGYPPKGTHAHSMVQVFMALGGSELDAFRAYAEVYPDDCLLLVDTINTLESGIPNAITIFEELSRKGHKPVGIRLDSGDLAHLSVKAARMLDEAGFSDTAIVLSNDLDEMTIWQIKTQISEEAPRYDVDPAVIFSRLAYGVGTKLITSAGAGALSGVYKLVAIEDGGAWLPAIKISDTPEKTPNPGQKRLWRVYDDRGKATADVMSLADEDLASAKELRLHHPTQYHKRRILKQDDYSRIEPLQVDVLRDGKLVMDFPSIDMLRQQRINDVNCLHSGVRRIMNPHVYHVSLTDSLWEMKQSLIDKVTGPSIQAEKDDINV